MTQPTDPKEEVTPCCAYSRKTGYTCREPLFHGGPHKSGASEWWDEDLIAELRARRSAPTGPLAPNQIAFMVQRFLGWKLPANFSPDAGISFKPAYNEHTKYPGRHEPIGTNLFDATQAEAMVRYLIDGMPLATAPAPQEGLADDLRAAGWAVAVHNDYRQDGEARTFWLFTKEDRAVKGEGKTDAEALNAIRRAIPLPEKPAAPPPSAGPTVAETLDMLAGIPSCHCGAPATRVYRVVITGAVGGGDHRIARCDEHPMDPVPGASNSVMPVAPPPSEKPPEPAAPPSAPQEGLAARDVAAYLLDRADQYNTESPCWVALADAAHNIMRGAVAEAVAHGEFDAALYARVEKAGGAK